MKTTIVIPYYNEAERIRPEAASDFLATQKDCKLLLVNDGSTDKTASLLLDIQQRNPAQITILTLPKNQGKAEAVRQGLLQAKECTDASLLGLWDADLATPLADVTAFSDYLEAHPDCRMVTGCRLQRLGSNINRKLHRHYLGRVFATIISNHLKLPVYDTQCGAKLFRRELLDDTVLGRRFQSKWFFDVEIYKRLIQVHGRDVLANFTYEYPLSNWNDVGDSKVNMFRAFYDLFAVLLSK